MNLDLSIPALMLIGSITGFVVTPGSLLRPGMELIYANNGSEGSPWLIDRVTRDTVLGSMHCSVVELRTSSTQVKSQRRIQCVRGDTLWAWDSTTSSPRATRPIGAHMTMEMRTATTGSLMTYQTADTTTETVDGVRIGVVHTTISWSDSTGQIVRRMRERYALALGSATGGTIEVRDPQSGGLRTQTVFQLTRIVRPDVDRASSMIR